MSQSPALRVQICNERLLARFGVDRLLLLAGRHFVRQGATVSFACLRYDPDLVDKSCEVTRLPIPLGLDIHRTERLVANLTIERWLVEKPDVIVIGGWPFFETAARARALGVASIFIDAGAVPHEGLQGHALFPQLELRRVRQTLLPFIGRVLPISEFIRDTQTLPDRCREDGVSVVLLGGDHLSRLASATPDTDEDKRLSARIGQLRAAGKQLIFNLGRFEAEGYKNSAAMFRVIEALCSAGFDPVVFVLARAEELKVPDELRRRVVVLGEPDDNRMAEIMRQTQLGLSMSLWEGFNLPLAEMQALGKPVLVFNVGAHPEVVAHPWQLCADETDMARKAAAILGGDPIYREHILPALAEPERQLRWCNTLRSWWRELVDGVAAMPAAPLPAGRRMILMDVSNSVRDPANSGVIRVARQTARCLERDERLDVVLVTWNHELHSYALANGEAGYLRSYNGPVNLLGSLVQQGGSVSALDRLGFGRDPRVVAPWLVLIPEVVLDGTLEERFRWLRYRGFLATVILYDLIPVYHPEFCSPEVRDGYRLYIDAVRTADQCLSISGKTLADFIQYCRETEHPPPHSLATVWLPSQLGNVPRVTGSSVPVGSEVRILCVSTLEPRKNHATLVDAYCRLVARRRDLSLRLVLVGNEYVGTDDLLAKIDKASDDGIAIEWLGVITDDALRREYGRARFTVYPSIVEGFGIPIVESLWMGRPCICSSDGVMAELAADGGCLTVDVLDADRLSEAMERLAADDRLVRELCTQAASRKLTTWDDYANQIANELLALASLAETGGQRQPGGEAAATARGLIEQMLDGAGARLSRVDERVGSPSGLARPQRPGK